MSAEREAVPVPGEPHGDESGDAEAVAPVRPAPTGSREDMKKAMDESDLVAQLGGVRGVVDSSVAGVVFALVYSVSGQNLRIALWAAVLSGVAVAVVSLVQRRTIRQAVFGFIFGVGIAVVITRFTGRPQDFYLWPILKNAAFALLYLVSMLVRWPLIGLMLGPLLGEGTAWRRDPPRFRAYMIASGLWVAMFGLRFAVQLPLYLAGNVNWLGIQSIPLGLPLFLLVCWGTFLVLARVPLAKKPVEDDAEGQAADEIGGRGADVTE